MLLRHSAIYLFSRGVPAIVGFATIVVYTRLLSPEAYGQYTLVITGAVIAYAVLYQWLSASILRFFPNSRNDPAQLLSAVFRGFLFVSFLSGIAGILLALLWHAPKWYPLIAIGIILTWVQAWFSINLELVRIRLAPVRYGLISLLKAVIALGLGIVLILCGFDALGALGGLLAGFLIAGLWASWGQWDGLGSVKRPSRALIRSLLSYGLPLTASFALAVIISSTDRFMLAGLIGDFATGLYAAGQGLARQSVGNLMTMINLAAYPIIVRTLENDGADAARIQLRNNAILLLGIGLPATAGFIVLAPNLAHVFLGKEFQAAGTELIPWFAGASLLSGIRSYYFDLAFYLGKRTRLQGIVMAIAALLNVALNFWFIPIFGILGAAYATITAYLVALVFSVMLGRQAFRLPSLYGEITRLTVACAGMVLVLFLLPDYGGIFGLTVSIVTGGTVYTACVIALNIGGVKEVATRFFIKGKDFLNGFQLR